MPKSCGISSLVSCWNYLFSNLGQGTLDPISQEEALQILGMDPPYDNVKFGSFTGNQTLINWFGRINSHFNVRGKARIFFKLSGKSQTKKKPDEALNQLKVGLQGNTKTYIYHCYNHYFCPIGYELMPTEPSQAYAFDASEFQPWLAIGDCSRNHSSIQFIKWSDVIQDLETLNPEFFDVRKIYKGVQTKTDPNANGKKAGTNCHCILEFTKFK